MELLTMDRLRVLPNAHALSIPPFSQIWERDPSPGKEQAISELTYIELMCSLKKTNPYAGYSPDLKHLAVSKAVFRNTNYEPDELVTHAMEEYNRHLQEQMSVRLLTAAKSAVEKLIEHIRGISLKERTKGGAAVYKPAEVMKALSEADKVLGALQSLQKKVEEDVYSSIKTRANRGINPLEE